MLNSLILLGNSFLKCIYDRRRLDRVEIYRIKVYFRKFLIIGCLFLASDSAHSAEYFGRFLDQLKGIFITDAKPRPEFKIDEDFRFEDPNGILWLTPKGTQVDGASIPKFFWSIIGGPFEGAYIKASVIHDHYCETKERTAHDTHRNFYYGMRASGVSEWKSILMHWAVSTFGPSWRLERRVIMSQTCTDNANNIISCEMVPKMEMVTVSEPALDLTNPDILALAISKTNAVARTLLTSDGQVLDVSSAGQVSATLASIESNAANYRELFKSEDVVYETEKLGLLSQTERTSLASIQPWNGNRIPSYDEVKVLNAKFNEYKSKDMPFKLDSESHTVIMEHIDLEAIEFETRMQKSGQF